MCKHINFISCISMVWQNMNCNTTLPEWKTFNICFNSGDVAVAQALMFWFFFFGGGGGDCMSVASIKHRAMELMPVLRFTVYTTSCDLNLVSGSQQQLIWGHEILVLSRPICKCKFWLNHGRNTVFDWQWYAESLHLRQYLIWQNQCWIFLGHCLSKIF